jgi:two-component system, NtrC family, nitrogen regulation sensor histidine kinase NtrY
MVSRFRIKWKLTVAFAALVILPALVAQIVNRYLVAGRFSQEFEARVNNTAEQVRAEYIRNGAELTKRIAGLFEGTEEEPTILDRYLAELRQGSLSTKTQNELIDTLPSIAKSSGLAILKLIDKRGVVIAQTPLRGKEGHKDQQSLALLQSALRTPLLLKERLLMPNGTGEDRLVVMVVVEVSRYGEPLYAIGAQEITNTFLGSLLGQSKEEISLDGPSGPLIGNSSLLEKLPHREILWAGFQDNAVDPDAYRVVVAVSDKNLRETIEELTLVSGGVVAAGVLLAWILGFLLAGRLTHPIDDLVRRAEEVARGDLQGVIPKTSNDEIGELISSFNEMTRRLIESQDRLRHAERVAAWQEIARRLAHEIKNPLFPIQMSIETLRKTLDHKNFKEIFEESTTAVLEEVERLKTIVSEFSQFARLPEPKFTPVDLMQVANAAIKLCAAVNEESQIQVVTHFDASPPLPADREQLTQIFLNLLSNAREAMPQGGTITVNLKQQNGEAQLSISDTGAGLSEEAKAKIFTPYFTTKEKGTGLGLAIVHRIMTAHSGRITIDGKEGQGATFTLHFPVA